MNPESLDTNIIYIISEVAHNIHREVTKVFRASEYDITVEQFAVLTVLWYEQDINQNEIAFRLNRDKTTIARVISNMVKGGFIQKKADSTDQRNRKITLTPLGEKAQKKLVELTGKIYTQSLRDLNPDHLKQSIRTLSQINENIK